ncbi:MAG: ABC transporter ATP-binding protein [Actinobacteria bacterium]|nr:ABC transporter ATP-binding protein [Actinomycetota bacterium]
MSERAASLSLVPDFQQAPVRLSFRAVSKGFTTGSGARIAAIEDVSFDIGVGEFVCLIGPSGCGKTTILNLLAGLERPDDGDVLLDGAPILEPGPDRALLFQDPALFPWLSVRGNVEHALRLRGIAREDLRDTAESWLGRVHLTPFADLQPHELSGGMRHRAALVRALACQPEVLLADEPFGALDAQMRQILQEELQQVWTEFGKTFVFVTHNVREATFLADRVILLSARPGRPIEEYRITTPRPRRFDDVLLRNVVLDTHDRLSKEVERAADEEALRPGLA